MGTHVRISEDDGDFDGADIVELPMPKWERRLVVTSLAIHVTDVVLDVLVLFLLATAGFSDFALGSGMLVLWAWLASSLYISCTSSTNPMDDVGDGAGDTGIGRRLRQAVAFACNLTQVQIFVEAYRCLFRRGDGDYFHTLRLMEAILEAAPNSLVHVFVLAYWPERAQLQPYALYLMRMSIAVAFTSVSISFAMFEQKVQQRTTGSYVVCCALMRFFEIASRTTTLALFATMNYPNGIWCMLVVDYLIMVGLTLRHKSVRNNYSLFLSLPLVLISYEPVVWRREDHVVPKDWYYLVRAVEFVFMWIFVLRQQASLDESSPFVKIIEAPSWLGIALTSAFSSIGLVVMFPFVNRIARRHELSRDGADEGAFDPLQQGEDFYSSGSEHDSDVRSDGEDEASAVLLPSSRAQREAAEGTIEQE